MWCGDRATRRQGYTHGSVRRGIVLLSEFIISRSEIHSRNGRRVVFVAVGEQRFCSIKL